jgi:hypothetical protein
MKILFVIPHYYGSGLPLYGSTDASKRAQRIASLRATVTSLHQHLGRSQHISCREQGQKIIETKNANQIIATDIEIIICTTGENHLVDELGLSDGCFRHITVDVDNPLYLGFESYSVFEHAFGKYDWYCYLEDDVIIADPFFFLKLQTFYETVRDTRYLLQPNRYEVSNYYYSKMYIDAPFDDSSVMEKFRLPNSRTQIDLPFLGTTLRMLPAENAHSGCFFLTSDHMQHLLEQPWYGKQEAGCYAGPLESAATLFILTLFHVFKPAPECASFLEVYHSDQRFLQ